MPSDDPQVEFAKHVVTELRRAGHEALWAGGCVRDGLLGIAPKDYDVATSAEPAQVREVFGRRRTIPVGAAFGVITVLGGKGRDPIEVATFRSDGRYLDGRRPESVEFTDAEHDALRRDFTINGLFFDPVDQRVIDYVGGREDLNRKLVRAIGDPRERFTEDKLRLLRAVRFAATFGFEIEAETLRAVREMADQIEVVSAERIGAELRQVLSHPHAARGLALLAETGLLGHLLPEIAPWDEAADVRWAALLERLERLGDAPLAVALAAVLLEAGGVDVRELGRRLRFTNKEAVDAAWIIAGLGAMPDADAAPWSRLQPLLADPRAADLVALAKADLGPEHPGVLRCERELKRPPEQLNPAPLVSGNDLIAAGLRPGPGIAQALRAVRNEQLDGRLHTKAEALEAVKQGLGRD